MYPIPKWQETLLSQGNAGNFSLYFARMTHWVDSGETIKHDILVGDDGRGHPRKESSIAELGRKGNMLLPQTKAILLKAHERQRNVLRSVLASGGFAVEIHAKLATPFVSGLGSGHPTEAGMILDRNTGLPSIPASSVKGVLRLAHALDIAAKDPSAVQQKSGGALVIDDRSPTLRKYFGDTDTAAGDAVRGQLVFLDAYPAGIPAMKTDIMNPHFGGYYAGKTEPVETENPVPVKFLAVREGITYVFRVLASPLLPPDKNEQTTLSRSFDENDKDAVASMFDRAFSDLGFGGKTSIGYGRFDAGKSVPPNEMNDPFTLIMPVVAAPTVSAPAGTIGVHRPQPAPPRTNIRSGQTVAVELLEEKTKKGGWKVRCRDDAGISGAVLNPAEIPLDKKAGDVLQMTVHAASGSNSIFRYKP